MARRTFQVIRRNFVTLLFLSIVTGVPSAIVNWREVHFPAAGLTWAEAAALSAYTISAFVLAAAAVPATMLDFDGKRASIAECVSAALRNLFRLILLALLLSISIIIGFILLVVPGIFLLVALLVVVPMRVVEGEGAVGSLDRSMELTKGHRWAVFGLLIGYAFPAFTLGIIAIALVDIIGESASNVAVAAQTLADMMNNIVLSVGTAVIYFELRTIKEGVGPDKLASVFD